MRTSRCRNTSSSPQLYPFRCAIAVRSAHDLLTTLERTNEMNNQMYNAGYSKPQPMQPQKPLPGGPLPPQKPLPGGQLLPQMSNGQINGNTGTFPPRQVQPMAPGSSITSPSNFSSHYSNANVSNTPQFAQNQTQSAIAPQPGGRPQTIFRPQSTQAPYSTPQPLAQMTNNMSDPSMNLLPPPFPNQYVASTPSPVQTPGQSAPQSTKSSRNPSPLPNNSYDMVEGQFPSNPITPSGSSNSLVNSGGKIPTPNAFSNTPRNVVPQNRPYNNMASRYPASSVPQNTYAAQSRLPGNPMPPPSQQTMNSNSAYSSAGQPNVPLAPPSQPTMNSNNAYSSAGQPNVPLPPHQSSAPNSTVGGPTGRRQYPQTSAHAQQFQGQSPYGGLPVPSSQNSTAMPPSSVNNFTSPVQSSYGNSHQHGRMPVAPPNMTQAANPSTYPGQTITAQPQYNRNFAQPGQRPDQLSSQLGSMNIFNGSESFNIMQNKNVLPETRLVDPVPPIPDPKSNCKPEVFRCTLNSLPESQNLLQKVRLPLGILIHPFRDLSNLPVIQCSAIVRCRSCRTYINPFVYFVDQKKWKCNLCYKINELPEEFLYDPVSKQYGDPSRRPEVKSATIEFIAPSEYMLRPPQPAVYIYLLDVTRSALATGYLDVFCETLLAELDNVPGDARTQIGFITYDTSLHFYNMSEGLSQPQMMVVSDIDDVFIPCPDNLLVNIHESKELVRDFLRMLPSKFADNCETQNALGAALQAAYKLMAPTGGRVTVMNTCLPSVGPGSLKSREDPNQRAAKDIQNLGPANDFYKKLSLDCSGQQIAVDLFNISCQYTDVATLSCISKFSGGCLYHYPGFQAQANPSECVRFRKDLQRYITRKIGFEAVMRIRCTRGISIHTFHGNFFVRSTDLLSLPNINPDAAFAMQMSLEESLSDCKTACFQAALLYTSSKGERRIRVHTLCLPITSSVSDVIANADQQAIASLVAKMAIDRSLNSSMPDAREALINVIIDALDAFKKISPHAVSGSTLLVPMSLRLLPLYVLSILKSVALRVGMSTKLDERVIAMNQVKTLPLQYFIQAVYPDMYPVHALEHYSILKHEDSDVPQPPLLHLSSERTDRHGAYLLDSGKAMYLYVCSAISDSFCQNILGFPCFAAIPDDVVHLPDLDTSESKRLRSFVKYLNSRRPFYATFRVIRDDSKLKVLFLQHLIEDRTESTYSYYEFLQHIEQQISK